MRNRWRLISLILVVILLLQVAAFGGWHIWNWQQDKAIAAQDKTAVEAFRTKYGLTTDTPVSGSRLTGATVYIFKLEGKTIILLGQNWIELNDAQ